MTVLRRDVRAAVAADGRNEFIDPQDLDAITDAVMALIPVKPLDPVWVVDGEGDVWVSDREGRYHFFAWSAGYLTGKFRRGGSFRGRGVSLDEVRSVGL